MRIAVQQTTHKTGSVELEDHMYIMDEHGKITILPFYEFMIDHALSTGNIHEKRIIVEDKQ